MSNFKSGTNKVQSIVIFLSNSSVINTLKVKESLLKKVKNPLRQKSWEDFRRNEVSKMTLIYLVFQGFECGDRYLWDTQFLTMMNCLHNLLPIYWRLLKSFKILHLALESP